MEESSWHETLARALVRISRLIFLQQLASSHLAADAHTLDYAKRESSVR